MAQRFSHAFSHSSIQPEFDLSHCKILARVIIDGKPTVNWTELGKLLYNNATCTNWLARKDSNLDKLDQNQLCYHYTTGEILRNYKK